MDRPVLYIDSDLRAHYQLVDLAKRYGTDAPKVEVFQLQRPSDPAPQSAATFEDDPHLFDLLAGLLKTKPYWALVVDTVSRFCGSAKLESANDLTRWVTPLQRIAGCFRIPIFLLGHANAQGTTLGRHLTGVCPIGWHASKEGILKQARAYAKEPAPLRFSFTDEGPLAWDQVQGHGEESGTGKTTSKQKEIKAWILARLKTLFEIDEIYRADQNSWTELKASAIQAGLITEKSKGTFSKAIKSLVEASDIIEKRVKSGSSYPERFYSLPLGDQG